MRGKPSKLYSESLNDLIVTGTVERYKFKNPGRYNYEKLDVAARRAAWIEIHGK